MHKYQNTFRVDKNDNNRNHNNSNNKPSSIKQNSNLLPIIFPLTLFTLSILASTITRTNQCLKCPIKPLADSKSKYINKHITHANSCNKYRLISMSNIVSIYKLNKHIKDHRNDWPDGQFENYP